MRASLESAREVNPMLEDELTSAVVVTFHPRSEYVDRLEKICAQVDLLIVIDNGSKEGELEQIRLVRQRLGFRLIENGENLGIAAALNCGVREAQREGCQWVGLFDQDSIVTEGFIAAMISEFRMFRKQRNIMQIVPRYIDPETGIERAVSTYEDGGIFLACTSGSLFSMEAFEKCGLFQENLFIYCVDDDYSLRLRKEGFFIGENRNAILLHRSGHPTSRRLLGKTISTKNYGPEVRYYYARNKIRMLRLYGKTFPRIIVPTLREFVTIPLKIVLMEDDSWRKIKLFLLGLADGITGRMGRLRQAG
jgi:rhamnosyltransferase